MRKYFVLLALLFIILQSSPIFLNQYSEYPFGGRITSNLTSFVTPFEHINQNSVFGCSDMTLRDRYKLEFQQLERYRLHQTYTQPSINRHYRQDVTQTWSELPYFYSLWRTSSILPRLMTPCEHQGYIKLIKEFQRICQENEIEFMISHGTLLGSYRNHGKTFC